MKKKVLILGTLPPPVGGITIHLKRFIEINKNDNDFELSLFDLRKRKVFRNGKQFGLLNFVRTFFGSKIVHIHISNNSKIFFAILSKIFGKKVIYTQHNSRINDGIKFRFFFLLCDKFILVNNKNTNLDSSKLNENKISVIPAFIEPTELEELPESLLHNLEKFDFIISANCFKNVQFDGKQLYGFDTLIDTYFNLVSEDKISNSLLVLVDPSNSMKDFFENEKKKFKSKNNNEILFVGSYIDFSSLIKKSDVVVRPTRSDGDALTVREALHFDIPIIASDCSIRPEGTILFNTGDAKDLAKKIHQVYAGELEVNNHKKEDFNKNILENYRILIK
ncbi:MAG: glycosyltransferase [Ignavibacteriae bacterium]|nr:glycosyltransferase family 1 protein [Ignavibacteriota bacterium]NOH00039.1 glycosyltransferase [Ignavibacteriota bacterium]